MMADTFLCLPHYIIYIRSAFFENLSAATFVAVVVPKKPNDNYYYNNYPETVAGSEYAAVIIIAAGIAGVAAIAHN